ncbi:ATP-binding protein [Bradyrhizobium sp.]|uniref:Dph6-related ATP pyrophosphatase n=1 Tax=Bradyrhizobium sp. TaxID=376 RepID=UPI003C76FCEB
MSSRPKALISWSSGKDSAFALHEVRRAGEFDVVGALTTVTETFGRVSIHGVRQEILLAQLNAAGLPPHIVPIPYPCPNEIYEARMGEAVAYAVREGVTHIIFGDLYLADIRAYREQKLKGTGVTPVFPLWERPTLALAHAMIASRMEAYLATVDRKKLPAAFAGRKFDLQLLADLPAGVDPCGENGEFHTCVTAGPMFAQNLAVTAGERIERDGYAYCDLVLGPGADEDVGAALIVARARKEIADGGPLLPKDAVDRIANGKN